MEHREGAGGRGGGRLHALEYNLERDRGGPGRPGGGGVQRHVHVDNFRE